MTNRQLTIGIDVRTLETPEAQRRGFGRYISNLVRAMAQRAPQHKFVLLGEQFPWAVQHLQSLCARPNVRYTTYHPSFHADLNVFLVTEPLSLRPEHRVFAASPHDVPCATIFYDLIPLAYEQEYLPVGSAMRKQFFENLQILKEGVSRYLAISDFVADDLCVRLSIPRENVCSISGGLDDVFRQPPTAGDIQNALAHFRLQQPYFIYAGGTDFRKNLGALLAAFRMVRERTQAPVTLALVGETDGLAQSLKKHGDSFQNPDDPLRLLGYVSDDALRALYGGAAAFVFPSLYEGFGLPALEAMASHCPVIAANGSALREVVGDAGILIDPLRPSDIAAAMSRLLANPPLCDDLRRSGAARATMFTWDDVAAKALSALDEIARPGTRMIAPTRRLRVAIQNRESAFVAPGGDTTVMEQLYRTLRARDVDVDLVAPGGDVSPCDVVHLVNLTVKDMPRTVAQTAARANRPLAITTLYEDWPLHMERSVQSWRLFKEYLERGKDERHFTRGLAELKRIRDDSHVGKDDVVASAAMLFACGDVEADNLRTAYAGCDPKIRIAKFGSRPVREIAQPGVEKVRELLGFERYILCCGRLETRKNQLMLLKALDDLDIPIVFAAGGFTYQPSYAKLVEQWPRRAPVKIIGRVRPIFLTYLMGGAAAHVLPSWYELPGLVTLEAASAGTAVVASDWGAIRDYLPEAVAHFCQPDDPDSIRCAVEQALSAGPNPRAKEIADTYTWDAFGDATLAGYEAYLSKKPNAARTPNKTSQQQSPIAVEQPMDTRTTEPALFNASIIIPVYAESSAIQETLEAVCRATEGVEYEVILVDNRTPDDVARVLHSVEGDVSVVRVSEVLSFAAACRRGAQLARGEFLVLLSADSIVQENWLPPLLDSARRESAVGAVGMRCLNDDGTVRSAGLMFDQSLQPKYAFAGVRGNQPASCESREMQAVSLKGCLLRREAFANAQVSNDWQSALMESANLCLQLRDAGWTSLYCAQSTRIEYGQQNSSALSSDERQRFVEQWSHSLHADEQELESRYTLRTPGIATAQPDRPAFSFAEPENSSPGLENASLTAASELYAAGRLADAANMLQQLVEQHVVLAGEDSFEVWQTLGNCLARLNRFEEAEKAYYEAMRQNDASERPHLGLGSVAIMQENWQAAMYSFMTALAKNPETGKAEFGVGLAMAARNMHREALDHFERVLSKNADNSEVLFYFYRSAMEAGEPARAIPALEQYVQAHPQDTDFIFNLCGACWKAGHITQAADLCQQVLAREPHHAAARDVLRHLQVSVGAHA